MVIKTSIATHREEAHQDVGAADPRNQGRGRPGPKLSARGCLVDGKVEHEFPGRTTGELRQETYRGAVPSRVRFSRQSAAEVSLTKSVHSYFLCEKTDGIRLLLYITTGDQGEEIVYLIDRKNDYYYLPNGSMSS